MKRILKQFLSKYFPVLYVEILWIRRYGRKLNWENPKDLNEKILWLEFCTDTSEWTRLADKYKVREFVKERGLEEILVKLYGKWDDAKDIDYDSLPQKFVLKCNHDCGSYHIIDKTKDLDIKAINTDLNRHLKQKYGAISGETHYTRISPCIIAEEYLESKSDSYSSSLVDYKVWCLNGKPYCVWTAYNRTKQFLYVNVYDLDWNVHPEWSVFTDHYRDGRGIVPRPKSLDKMLNSASTLAAGFPEVRIDFYDIDGKLYFGEMTFTSAEGRMNYFTDEFLEQMGGVISLDVPRLPLHRNCCYNPLKWVYNSPTPPG